MRKILRAIEVAIKAHGMTSRKLREVPYVLHPVRLMLKVYDYLQGSERFKPLTETMLCVAALHDIPEDTRITIGQLTEEFGEEVGEGINWLTNASKKPGALARDGTPLVNKKRAERTQANLVQIMEAPPQWQIVKMFNHIDNLYDLIGGDHEFIMDVYLPESYQLHMAIGNADPEVGLQLLSAINWLSSITRGYSS